MSPTSFEKQYTQAYNLKLLRERLNPVPADGAFILTQRACRPVLLFPLIEYRMLGEYFYILGFWKYVGKICICYGAKCPYAEGLTGLDFYPLDQNKDEL